jgi:membrane associated rhomboid family serine protease
MGVIEFFVLCVVVVLMGALAVWAINYFAPSHPAIVDKIIWGVVIVVILFALVQATGILGRDPRIPHI